MCLSIPSKLIWFYYTQVSDSCSQLSHTLLYLFGQPLLKYIHTSCMAGYYLLPVSILLSWEVFVSSIFWLQFSWLKIVSHEEIFLYIYQLCLVIFQGGIVLGLMLGVSPLYHAEMSLFASTSLVSWGMIRSN